MSYPDDDHVPHLITTEVDGQPVNAVAHASPDLTERGQAALTELIQAAARQFAADLEADPSIAVRQEAAMARIRERNQRLRRRTR